MTVQFQMLMSMMLFTAAALALQVRFAIADGPAKVPVVQQSTPAFDQVARIETVPVRRAGAAAETKARGYGMVSSAMTPLDLGVLSMADFGDIEPTR